MVVIKASFGGDLKRFELDEKSLSWNTLKEELRRRFELESTCQFFVKYHDAEGDLITLSCDSELRESLSGIENKNGKSVLRLEFTVSNTIVSSSSEVLQFKEEKEEEKIEQVNEEPKQIEEVKMEKEKEKEVVKQNEEQRIIEELEKQREEEQKRIEKEFQQKIETEKRKFAEEQKRKLEEEEQRKKVEEERQKMEQEKKRIEELQRELEEKERKLTEEKRRAEERNKLEEEERKKRVLQEQERATLEEEEEQKRRVEEQKRKEQENQKASTNKKLHTGVVCNNCKTQIIGTRYKCGNCSDFDFCESCEGQDLHNPNHVFIKIKTPLSCNISSQYRRALLPNLYPLENFESNTQSSNQPSVITLKQLSTPTLSLSSSSSSSTSNSNSTSTSSTNSNTITKPMTQQEFYEAQFVRDVNLPDGTIVTGGKTINKKWRMKNSGSQTWPAGTKLVYVGGNETKGTKSVPVPSIKPNEEVDITIPIVVPKTLGRFLTLWRLQSSVGENFGHRIWCDLVVAEEEPETLVIPEDSVSMIPFTGSITPQLVTSNEVDYTQQMSELVVMGFNDRTRNLRLLTKHQGDLQETINELCS